MKDKIITIKPVKERYYTKTMVLNLRLLELNIMKKAWKSYGVDIYQQMSAPGLKRKKDWVITIKRYGTDTKTMVD